MPNSTPVRSRGRHWLAGALTLLVLALVLVVVARRPSGSSTDGGPLANVPDLGPYPVTLLPGLHLLGGLAPAAAYVVETADGLVLVDSGLDQEAGPLKRDMAALGLDWRRLRAIFLTHVHGDHSGGAAHLRAATGAKVYAGRGDAAVLRAGGPREAFFSNFYMPGVATVPTPVDVELTGEQEVTVGGVRFRALCTPGHTTGSVCYLMERGDVRALFSGDVIWSLGAAEDRTAWPLGTYITYLAPRYRGDAAAYLATLRGLAALPPPQLVLPGHPRNDRVPSSPAVTPAHWQRLLDLGTRELEVVEARLAADGANFLDGTPKQLLPGLFYLGDFQDTAVYALWASSKMILVGAPGGGGLGRFIEERWGRLGQKPAAPAAVLLASGDPEVAAGLPELVEKYRPQVVAPPATWERLKAVCPSGTNFVPAEEWARQGGLPLRPIPLGGRGTAPAAYLLSWAGKSVLFSGRVPAKLTRANVGDFVAEFSSGRGDIPAYLASLRRLADLKPDLWLPAFPAEGQNANLYDHDWEEVLVENRRLFPAAPAPARQERQRPE